jgi:hypothetical protein
MQNRWCARPEGWFDPDLAKKSFLFHYVSSFVKVLFTSRLMISLVGEEPVLIRHLCNMVL